MNDLPLPITVVCHDAGAANIIFSWLEEFITHSKDSFTKIKIFCLGPASALIDNFKIRDIPISTSLEEAMENSKSLIVGTSWGSSLELKAQILANKMGIRTVTVIDHWINYQERFLIDGLQVYPYEIWVTDEYAYAIARKEFPNSKIELKVNLYLSQTVNKIIKKKITKNSSIRVLYVLEPMRTKWSDNGELGEFDALNYFMNNLDQLSLGSEPEIVLRPHPSDPPDKYNNWLSRISYTKISLDSSPNLETSISLSNVVVGCQTMAMVIALNAGKRVISSLPPWAPSCALPHLGIEKMATQPPVYPTSNSIF